MGIFKGKNDDIAKEEVLTSQIVKVQESDKDPKKFSLTTASKSFIFRAELLEETKI